MGETKIGRFDVEFDGHMFVLSVARTFRASSPISIELRLKRSRRSVVCCRRNIQTWRVTSRHPCRVGFLFESSGDGHRATPLASDDG
jgi:hypothetical protein